MVAITFLRVKKIETGNTKWIPVAHGSKRNDQSVQNTWTLFTSILPGKQESGTQAFYRM